MEIPTQFDLRKERFNRGITRADLARMLGVSRQTLMRIELKGVKPMAPTALKIANWLETTPAELWPAETADDDDLAAA